MGLSNPREWCLNEGIFHLTSEVGLKKGHSHLLWLGNSAVMLWDQPQPHNCSCRVLLLFLEDCHVVCRVLLSVLGCEPSLFQVIYRALSPANKIEDPYSPEAQDLLKLTNLRLLLLKRQECPCHGSGLVEKPQRFAHYAIYDLIIRGSCFCNGHAEECELANKTGVVENMVSSRHLSAH